MLRNGRALTARKPCRTRAAWATSPELGRGSSRGSEVQADPGLPDFVGGAIGRPKGLRGTSRSMRAIAFRRRDRARKPSGWAQISLTTALCPGLRANFEIECRSSRSKCRARSIRTDTAPDRVKSIRSWLSFYEEGKFNQPSPSENRFGTEDSHQGHPSRRLSATIKITTASRHR